MKTTIHISLVIAAVLFLPGPGLQAQEPEPKAQENGSRATIEMDRGADEMDRGANEMVTLTACFVTSETGSDTLTYRFETRKTGAGGTSRSSQSGMFVPIKNEKTDLSTTSIGLGPDAECTAILVVFRCDVVIAGDSLVVPAKQEKMQ